MYCTDRDMKLRRLLDGSAKLAVQLEDGTTTVMDRVRQEHTAVVAGVFGASDTEFTPGNYTITTTPRMEFDFAFLPPDDPNLPELTLGWEGRQIEGTWNPKSRNLGPRLERKREVHWELLQTPKRLQEVLNDGLKDLGLTYTVTLEEVKDFKVTGVELMVITMYTAG